MPLTPFIRNFYSFYSNINFTGSIPACCLMLIIKYYKDWYKKQAEGEMLIRENMQAELQLLKAQIHPHFLFNTLNNIYSFTLTGSPQAAGLVDKLSGMIDYITIEGEKSFVPVEKEIQLINDYIGLEKVRYGDRLDMQVEINGEYKNKMIAPLLMIPFVENCFKHGASVMRGQQWISLSIHIKENQLDFNLSNSKPPQAISTNNKKGIGLANVQKRLQLLYPGKHFLKIESASDIYIVQLQVRLQQLPALDHTYKLIPKLQPV
jgi:LytS/YehU family sensor histidine kinase